MPPIRPPLPEGQNKGLRSNESWLRLMHERTLHRVRRALQSIAVFQLDKSLEELNAESGNADARLKHWTEQCDLLNKSPPIAFSSKYVDSKGKTVFVYLGVSEKEQPQKVDTAASSPSPSPSPTMADQWPDDRSSDPDYVPPSESEDESKGSPRSNHEESKVP